MAKQDAGRPEPELRTDILESGPGRPARRISIGLALALIVVAALIGYLVGSRDPAATTPAAQTPSSAAAAVDRPITATGNQCSAQLKNQLQLGIEVTNQSAAAVTLREARAVLPLPGLRETATAWGSCGQLRTVAGGDLPLPATATAWLTITFDVLVRCPAPIPVGFIVDYTDAGGSGTADLPGFADLGGVPYTRAQCPAGTS